MKAKKILPRTKPPKKAKPKIKASPTPQRRPPSMITSTSKVLCIFAGVFSQLRYVEARIGTDGRKCYHTSFYVGEILKQSTSLSDKNTLDMSKCGYTNSFMFLMYMSDWYNDPAYATHTNEKTLFRYHNQLLLKIKGNGNGNLEEVRVYYTKEASTPILRAPIEMDHPDNFIFLQVTSSKVLLVVRSSKRFKYSQNLNYEYTFSKLLFLILILSFYDLLS